MSWVLTIAASLLMAIAVSGLRKIRIRVGVVRASRPDGILSDQNVVITGASSGIGRATALALAGGGASVILVARRAGELDDLCHAIQARGGTAYGYPCDLTDAAAVSTLVERILDVHGPVDALINNAGRSIRRSVEASTHRLHDYQRTMAINYFAAVSLTLGMLPAMRARGRGHIVNISTIGVLAATPRFSAYAASKAALDQFSSVAATETNADGVSFTAVYMPLVRTPMVSPTRSYAALPLLSPERAAALVIDALIRRPRRLKTTVGFWLEFGQRFFPRLVMRISAKLYSESPDSLAAGGPGDELGWRPRFGVRSRGSALPSAGAIEPHEVWEPGHVDCPHLEVPARLAVVSPTD